MRGFHGRNETLSKVNFLADREKAMKWSPRDTIVLHLLPAGCNASVNSRSEVDFFEALEAVKRQYAIDENRILDARIQHGWRVGVGHGRTLRHVRHRATRKPFSGTLSNAAEAQTHRRRRTAVGAKLFHLYDATGYAANLYNTSTIAYNGEIDPQEAGCG